jgi:signal transduction histidine kinase
VKYSGTNQFKVKLSATEDAVALQVKDTGAGFDVEQAKKNRGLGLVSMQERVHLVHGQFSVESKPGVGTEVLVVVPLSGEGEKYQSLVGAAPSPPPAPFPQTGLER